MWWMTPRALALAAALLAPAATLAQAPAVPGAKPDGAAPAPAAPLAAEPAGGEIRGALPPPRLLPAPDRPLAPDTVLQEVVGTVRAVDRAAHRVTVATAGGEVTLSLDRNTLIYGPGGLVSVLDVVPGATVRAGRNGKMLAYWITVVATPAAGGASPAPAATTPAPAAPAAPAPSRADPG